LYLLDTNILLWWFKRHKGLGPKTQEIIRDPNNVIFVSSVSIWEISIKKGKGNLIVPDNFKDFLEHEDFTELNFTHEHASHILKLPQHHADPFDRMLISQAVVENLTLISTGNKISQYSVKSHDGHL
jgi:PIN domain nuclease of toxin-antitoxin system